jgi:hypothetical protein
MYPEAAPAGLHDHNIGRIRQTGLAPKSCHMKCATSMLPVATDLLLSVIM